MTPKVPAVLRIVEEMGPGLKRIYRHVCAGPFAIVSAWQSGLTEHENLKRTGELRRSLLSRSTKGFLPASGVFRGLPRESLLLPRATKAQALQLARRYGQKEAIWGSAGILHFSDEHGGGLQSGPVVRWSAYLQSGAGRSRVRPGKREAGVWRYDGVPFPPDEASAALAGKTEFPVELGQDEDIRTVKGVPFFYIYDAAGFFDVSFGFSVHMRKFCPTHLEIRMPGTRIRKMPKEWLAAYIPCQRSGK